MKRLQNLICLVIIAVFAVLLYINTLKSSFVYDDEFTIINNVLIKDLRNIPVLIQKEYFDLSGEMSYRPVVTFSYFLDYAVFGLNPWGFHLTNLLLHAFNGMLLYIFLASLIKEKERECLSTSTYPFTFNILPFLTALLFVSHPVLTEPVNAISYREDLLVFLFYISAFNIYLLNRRSPSYLLYIASCVVYFFALLSKEMAVTLPLIIYCYEKVCRGEEKEGLRSILYKRLWGYLTTVFVYAYLRLYYFYNPLESYSVWSKVERLQTISWLILGYLKMTLFPISLSAVYEIIPLKSLGLLFFYFFTILCSLLFTAFLMKNKEKIVAFGILFFVITLIPVYNIIPILHPFAERYLYLPIIGLLISVGFAVNSVYKRLTLKLVKVCILVAFIVLMSLYSAATIKRNSDWKENFLLWYDTVQKIPESSVAHANLGIAYAEKGKFYEAIRELNIALKQKPILPVALVAHNKLGYIYYEMGQLNAAEREFQITSRLDPNYSTTFNNLGIVHTSQGLLDVAIKEFNKALLLKPFDPAFHFNLGFAYAKKGLFEKAIQQYQIFLKLKTDDFYAHYCLGDAYIKKGLRNEAKREFEISLKLKPDFVPARQALEDFKQKD